jgi:hypothetical protein
MFCPKFWGGQFRYVNEITEKANRTLANIDDYNSYEHVLIHEWFHNSKTDQPGWHITDIVGDYITGFGSIYRSFACQHFAWRHVLKGGGVGDIEKETMLNADNWAWMFSYNWYKSIYNWKDNGSMKMGDFKLKGRDDEEEDPEAEEDPNKGAPIDPDGEDESTITIPGEYLTPEATTFDPEICIGCIVTTGGCFAA